MKIPKIYYCIEKECNNIVIKNGNRCRECANKIHSKRMTGPKNPFFGKHHTEESKQKSREKHIGKKPSKKTKTLWSLQRKGEGNGFYGKFHTKESKNLIRLKKMGKNYMSKEKRAEIVSKTRFKIMGNKHWNWKGGITKLISSLRNLIEGKQWRKQVFERDNYTCQKCGERGCYLNAHHKKAFSIIVSEFLKAYSQFSPIEDKETLIRLAITYTPFWDVDNGETLCLKCHNITKMGCNTYKIDNL